MAATTPIPCATVEEDLALSHQKEGPRASPVTQWEGIRLPMQETRVQSLIREDPTCRGATTEPVPYSPGITITKAHVPQSPCSATREATAVRSPRTSTRVAPTGRN